MQFAIYALDNPDTGDLRAQHRDAHRARLRNHAHPVTVVSAGPLFADDGKTAVGSIFVMEAESLEAVRRYMAEDPFVLNAIYGTVNIHPFTWTIGGPAS